MPQLERCARCDEMAVPMDGWLGRHSLTEGWICPACQIDEERDRAERHGKFEEKFEELYETRLSFRLGFWIAGVSVATLLGVLLAWWWSTTPSS